MEHEKEMKKGKQKMTTVSVDTKTLKAIKIIAGEIQAEAGKTPKLGEVLWRLITDCRMDVAERAERLVNSGEEE
jgi:hypothetical protein